MRTKAFLKVLGIMAASVLSMGTLAGCGNTSTSSTNSPASKTEESKTESASSTAASDNTDSTTSNGGVLKVGIECAYAPFNWTQTSPEVSNGDTAVEIFGGGGYAYGYDVIMAKKVAKELGMTLEVHKVEWDSILVAMDAGEYDCVISGMGRTKERAMAHLFTEPYYYRTNCVVVKKGSEYENITGLSDLSGKKVKVTTQNGTGWVPLLDQIPDAEKGANYGTTAEVFMALSNGTADLAVIDLPTAQSALITNNDLKIITFKEGDTFVGDDEMTNICMAARQNDTEMRDKLQSAIDKIGMDKAAMDKMMEDAMAVQPSANS